ncbi:hypothetical protein D3C76_1799620 [compost metagenome]
MFQFPFTQLKQMVPGAGAMLWVALGEAVQAQAQLILFGAKLDRAVAQRAVGLQVCRFLEFDFDAFWP